MVDHDEELYNDRIRYCFLLAICLSEIIMGGSIAASNILHALKGGGHDVKEIISDWLDLYYVSLPFSLYHQIELFDHVIDRALSAPYFWERAPAPHS